ncbi:serine/threonine-protein phosphatase 4 regulatory subunit 2 [Armigeres subalbatus]|uniref:serine/threonine-protein phosphatase 4 regulatory subunit 2 n=1 Tax=Armigeres subalbatus TaxID=124917 RepID=UPI002ED067B8
MSAMENRDEVLQLLERFTRLKQKEIPRELEDYLSFVARTGDTVYPWAAVKYFFRTKLSHVIMDFHDNTPSIADLPQCPNVDPFCYDRMKRTLLSRMESFNSAPFTIQRICELLNEPRKHYTRIDKFMRAVEKNILVVSTQEPGRRRSDSENGDSLDSIVNGDLEVNVDIEMDNEAFGIESNEMAAHAGVATVGPPVNITTPAHAEEVPPTMEPTEEQDTEKQVSDDEPKLAPIDNDINNLKSEETAPAEVNGSGEDDSGTTDDATVPIEKHLYSTEVQPNSDDTTPLDAPAEEPSPAVVDSVADDEERKLDEPLPTEQLATENEPIQESLDTDKPPSSAEVLQTGTEIDSADDEEPKAKMAKLSQEELPDTDIVPPQPLPEESATEDTTIEPISTAVVGATTEELSESDVVSVFPSIESFQSGEPESASESSIVSSDDPSASSAVSVFSTVSADTNSANSLATVEDNTTPVLDNSLEKDQTIDESQPAIEAIEPKSTEPSEAPEVDEQVVKSIDLEVHSLPVEAPDQPPSAQVISDEMETIPSAIVSENVMATDEEEQPPSEVVDTTVPMAADASETVKPDENAMDIDESSVEPMDQ